MSDIAASPALEVHGKLAALDSHLRGLHDALTQAAAGVKQGLFPPRELESALTRLEELSQQLVTTASGILGTVCSAGLRSLDEAVALTRQALERCEANDARAMLTKASRLSARDDSLLAPVRSHVRGLQNMLDRGDKVDDSSLNKLAPLLEATTQTGDVELLTIVQVAAHWGQTLAMAASRKELSLLPADAPDNYELGTRASPEPVFATTSTHEISTPECGGPPDLAGSSSAPSSSLAKHAPSKDAQDLAEAINSRLATRQFSRGARNVPPRVHRAPEKATSSRGATAAANAFDPLDSRTITRGDLLTPIRRSGDTNDRTSSFPPSRPLDVTTPADGHQQAGELGESAPHGAIIGAIDESTSSPPKAVAAMDPRHIDLSHSEANMASHTALSESATPMGVTGHLGATLTEVAEVLDISPAPAASESTPGTPSPLPTEDSSELPRVSVESFASYRDRMRLGANGHPEPAPWLDSGYADKLVRRFEQLLVRIVPGFGELWMLASAAQSLQLDLPPPEDIEELASLWMGNVSLQPRATPRSTELSGAYDHTGVQGSRTRWKLAVALEALTPSRGTSIPQQDIKPLIDQVEFDSQDLATALTEMLHLATYVDDPTNVLKSALSAGGHTAAESRQLLEQARAELKLRFDKAQQRKMFRFETDFCQELWLKYLTKIYDRVAALFPGATPSKAGRIAELIPALQEEYVEMMDRGGARHQDRRRMDRVIGEFLEAMREVDILMTEVRELEPTRTPVYRRKLNLEVFKRIISEPCSTSRPEELFLWRLLGANLRPSPRKVSDERSPLFLPLEEFLRLPPLLAYVPHLPFGPSQQLSYKDLSHPREAASWMLVSNADSVTLSTVNDLIAAVRRPPWDYLAPKVTRHLPEGDRFKVLTEESARRTRTLELQGIARGKADQLEAAVSLLASPLSEQLAAFRLSDTAADSSDVDGLAQAWLSEVILQAEAELGVISDALRRESRQRGPDTEAIVNQLLADLRFAEAIAKLRGNAGPSTSMRAVPFRWIASALYPKPSELLEDLEDTQLAERWREGLGDHNHQRALRTSFAKLVLGKLYERADKLHDRLAIKADDLRAEIARLKLNPSYVPQLTSISSIVIPGIGSQLTSSRFVQAAAEAASTDSAALVLLLVPRITKERRSQLLTEIRKRRLRAAVIDDLDLCRLTRPGSERGNLLLGLLELILEQQSWKSFCPFQLVEGQHVQMEMYVGREEEAQQLAHESRFTRLFSGRKLGKSALLRYVETNYDDVKLPSGRVLRVLYVSAVGIFHASALAETIIEALRARFRVNTSSIVRDVESPYDQLRGAFQAFRNQYKEASLLVVLDEADMFVEAELEEYQKKHEDCLSFLLRSRLEERDNHNLPYVRFLFTGYRVTNTQEGAWANWGEVLRLAPLAATVAADLIAGPLARLGIDVSEQAPVIAYRCGYQPAVLLRFGERLLALLDEKYPADTRDRARIEVSAADVAQVAEDDQVIKEIRIVGRNNFYGNDVGRVVYGALIGEFMIRGAAARLQHPEELLIRRLNELSPEQDKDLRWIRIGGESPLDEVRRQIDDLVDRQLLDRLRSAGAPPAYGLRFPHHLSLLAPLAREDELREEIERLATSRSDGVRSSTTRGLLARGQLTQLARTLGEVNEDVSLLPIFAWPSLLTNTVAEKILRRGLFDQLGLRVQAASDSLPHHGAKLTTPCAVIDVQPSQLADLLIRGGLPPSSMLVGNMDLARLVLRDPVYQLPGGKVRLLDLHWVGRLSLLAMSWWFKMGRGYEFSSNALQQIAHVTRGIPALVLWLDERLHQRDPAGAGMDLSDEQIAEAIDALESTMHFHLREQFVSALSESERRLLRMLRHAVEHYGALPEGQLEAAISEGWSDLTSEPSSVDPNIATLAPFSPADPDDRVALASLVIAGLVPSSDGAARDLLRPGSLAVDDPVLRMI